MYLSGKIRKKVPNIGALHAVEVTLSPTKIELPRIFPPVGNMEAALGRVFKGTVLN